MCALGNTTFKVEAMGFGLTLGNEVVTPPTSIFDFDFFFYRQRLTALHRSIIRQVLVVKNHFNANISSL